MRNPTEQEAQQLDRLVLQAERAKAEARLATARNPQEARPWQNAAEIADATAALFLVELKISCEVPSWVKLDTHGRWVRQNGKPLLEEK